MSFIVADDDFFETYNKLYPDDKLYPPYDKYKFITIKDSEKFKNNFFRTIKCLTTPKVFEFILIKCIYVDNQYIVVKYQNYVYECIKKKYELYIF